MAKQPQPEYRINLRPYRLFYFPFLLPIALLWAIFNKLSPTPIKIYPIRVDRIGQMIANHEQFLAELEHGLYPKEYRIFVHRDRPSNSVMLDILKRTLNIKQAFLPLFDVCHKLGGLGITSMEIHNISGRDPLQLCFKTPQHFHLSDKEIQEGKRQCRELGIDPEAPIIPVLGRDSTYLSSIKEPTDEDSYRNVDINTYIPAMQHLAKRFQVVRMGSVVKDALQISHANIWDYSLSGKRTELLDVYLSATCRFFLSCGTGLDAIAWCFRLPVLNVHYIPPSYAPIHKQGSMFILKKYWHTVEKRYLKLSELLETGIGEMFTPRELSPLNIVIHDNTPDEILEAVIEMEGRLDGTWEETEEDRELQERFWTHFRKQSDKHVIVSRIGASYLRNNPFWLE